MITPLRPASSAAGVSLGATSAMDPETSHRIAADVAFDCVGVSGSADRAISLTRKGGRIVLVGIFNDPPVTELNKLVLGEREMVGSFAYVNDFPRAIELVAEGRIPIDTFVSRQITLREAIERGFDDLVAEPGNYVRILIKPQP